ncbi:hypothetical protein LSH36_12g14041 [Paralvinella palmiformis]|uniref:PID domain-containing protein n=1 Tax=Paralvinella palmiformis TaxID=53620 RepID=A0AAD9KE70_9ANNE|nr:hypothetical protein LSH36_12g14041 [Paralvinella palmiformis]
MYRGGQTQPPTYFPPPGGLPDPMLLNTLTYPPPGAPGMPQPHPYNLEPMPTAAPGGPPIDAYLVEPPPKIPEPTDTTLLLPRANFTVSDINGGSSGGRLSGHIPLAKCRVLYIGTAIPTETSEGIKAVQEPLRKRYVTDGSTATSVPGVDAWLTAFSSGLLLQYIGDKNNPNDEYVTWLPIHTLHVSAAVKCVPQLLPNGERYSEFVALDSPAALRSNHPPIFAVIMRRTKGVKVLECHAFICKSNQAAMSLVQSTTHAYEHKEGWMEDEQPKYMQTLEGTLDTQNVDAQPTVPLFQPSTDQGRDRPNTKSNGYFLSLDNNSKLIKSYNVQNPNKLNSSRRPMVPPVVPAEPRPAGALVPAPSQYLADFQDFGGYPVFEFPGFVSPEKYKATMRQIRKERGRLPIPDNEPPLPPPVSLYPEPVPQRSVEEPTYLAPVRYDYQDDLGNYYYVGGDDPHSYRDYLPEPQNPDDLAYLAVPLDTGRPDYAKFIERPAPSGVRRRDQSHYDRGNEHRQGGNYFDDFANAAGYYP